MAVRTLPIALLVALLPLLAEEPYAPRISHLLGTQDVLVVVPQFTDAAAPSLPDAATWNATTAGLRGWIRQKSYGRADLRFTLYPRIVVLGKSRSGYAGDDGLLAIDCRNAVKAQGTDPALYHRFWVATKPLRGSTGLAQLGGTTLWIGFSGTSYVKHEFGHTFTTDHAEGWDDSLMLAPFKARVGWLTAGDGDGFRAPAITSAEAANGLFRTIDPETVTPVPGALRGLRISRQTANWSLKHPENPFIATDGRPHGVDGLAVYDGDDLPYAPGRTDRRFLLPGEEVVRRAQVLQGGVAATVPIRVRYLGTRADLPGQPCETVFSIALDDGTLPPTAQPDQARTATGAAVTIDVLANDRDPEGRALTISEIAARSARGGAVTIQSDRARYAPPAGFTGFDTFDYVVSDGRHRDRGTVLVAVGATPALPGAILAYDDFAGWTLAGGIGWKQRSWSCPSGLGLFAHAGCLDGRAGAFSNAGSLERSLDLAAARKPVLVVRWATQLMEGDRSPRLQVLSGGAWVTVHAFAGTRTIAWTETTIDLAAYAGQPDLAIRFQGFQNTSFENRFLLDHVILAEADGGAGNRPPVMSAPASAGPAVLVAP